MKDKEEYETYVENNIDVIMEKFLESNSNDFESWCIELGLDKDSTMAKIDYLEKADKQLNEFAYVMYDKYIQTDRANMLESYKEMIDERDLFDEDDD